MPSNDPESNASRKVVRNKNLTISVYEIIDSILPIPTIKVGL